MLLSYILQSEGVQFFLALKEKVFEPLRIIWIFTLVVDILYNTEVENHQTLCEYLLQLFNQEKSKFLLTFKYPIMLKLSI